MRAYQTRGKTFVAGSERGKATLDGATWKVTEDALVGHYGQSFERLPGHVGDWFAFAGYFGKRGELGR